LVKIGAADLTATAKIKMAPLRHRYSAAPSTDPSSHIRDIHFWVGRIAVKEA
jgi:hypothetical protein